MNLIIRPAIVSDAEVIAEFNRRMARETEHKDLDPATLRAGVIAMLTDPAKGRYFVAEDGPHPQPLSQGERGEIVGQLGVTLEWSDWRNGNFWWVQSVYVAEHARRRGVFRALFDHLLQAAKQEPNVIGVRLYVEHDNHVAQATYRQLGLTTMSYQLMQRYPL